ncbi:uncharacterized protein DNG_05930 [Cephalotrichum gorgonifer]|uniref:CENP-V/GFA domain-containing protein n=1 Tax=Cephalotrichum gorgonifer TaxID=2041049 RepID=A0AAE8N1C1_9PEZI|nr:uncharacterized protein DNG_05930 [Cephalotrichum gorgonifer]
MSQNLNVGPTPKTIEGGCLCGALRYRADFPPDHDWADNSSTCQCTQCRKNLSSLFLACHRIKPASCFQWTTDTSTLKHYRASKLASRPFCIECGSTIGYFPAVEGYDYVCIAVGTVDALYLFGEGADGVVVPKEGFGRALVNGLGPNLWCKNEIKGVTDNIPLLNRSERLQEE